MPPSNSSLVFRCRLATHPSRPNCVLTKSHPPYCSRIKASCATSMCVSTSIGHRPFELISVQVVVEQLKRSRDVASFHRSLHDSSVINVSPSHFTHVVDPVDTVEWLFVLCWSQVSQRAQSAVRLFYLLVLSQYHIVSVGLWMMPPVPQTPPPSLIKNRGEHRGFKLIFMR